MFVPGGVTIVDTSQFQESVDFRELKAKKIWGVYLRATMGAQDVDSQFAIRVAHAHSVGLRIGTYHYAYPNLHPGNEGASVEANHYASTIKRYHLNRYLSLRPMLDMEEHATGVEEWSRHFNKVCILRGLPIPLFYSYAPYIESMGIQHGPIGAGLVIAAYGRNDGKEYPVYAPKPWKDYVAHQFTSNGVIPGISGHCDVWHSHHPKAIQAPIRIASWFEGGSYERVV